MTMLLRRQMMTQKDSYITDGLVLWLDGINRGGVTGEWHDLIDPENIVTLNENLTEQTNGVYFPGNGNYYGAFSKTVAIDSDVGTIECAATLTAYDGTGRTTLSMGNGKIGGSIAANSSKSISFRWYCLGSTMQAYIFNDAEYPLKLTASGNSSIAYCNGKQGELTSTSSFAGANYPRLGSRGSGGPFLGTIHAIRVYNRKLTSAEMLHNQRLDNARFNLGLTI